MALHAKRADADPGEIAPLLNQDDHQSFGSVLTAETVTPVDTALDASGIVITKHNAADSDDQGSLEQGETERETHEGGRGNVVKIISVLLIGLCLFSNEFRDSEWPADVLNSAQESLSLTPTAPSSWRRTRPLHPSLVP